MKFCIKLLGFRVNNVSFKATNLKRIRSWCSFSLTKTEHNQFSNSAIGDPLIN